MDISTHYSDPPWGWDLTLPSKLVRACARARFHGLVLDDGDSSPCISRHTVKNPLRGKGIRVVSHTAILLLKRTGMSAPRGRRMSSAYTTNNGIGHKSKERSN